MTPFDELTRPQQGLAIVLALFGLVVAYLAAKFIYLFRLSRRMRRVRQQYPDRPTWPL